MFNVVKCNSYDEKIVQESLKKLINLKNFIKKGDKVLIKPNLLFAANPDKMITSHPSVLKAIIKELNKIGAKAIIADSPGGPFNKKSLNNVYKKSGLEKLSKEVKCELNQDFSFYEVKNSSSALLFIVYI